MRKHVLALAVLLGAAATPAGAQNLKERFSDLFRFGNCGAILCLSNATGHGNHFEPASVEGNSTILSFITNAVGANASNVPIAATTSGVTYAFERGVPIRTTTSAGPVFGERAQTLGKGRVLLGASVSTLKFTELRGIGLDALDFNFTHEDEPPAGLGDPIFENDVIEVKTNIELNLLVSSFVLSYGVSDRIDVGVALPVVHSSFSGRSRAQIITTLPSTPHFFGGTAASPELSAVTSSEGTATGLGDVAMRIKAVIGNQSSEKTAFAVLGDLRLPTGSEDDFLGTGGMAARISAIASARYGNFSPHVNAGVAIRSGDFQTNGILATVGFDHLLAPQATFAFDLLTEWQLGTNALAIPTPVTVQGRSVPLTNIPDKRSDAVTASFGVKLSSQRGLVGVLNAMVPILNGSLKPNAILSAGLEYAY